MNENDIIPLLQNINEKLDKIRDKQEDTGNRIISLEETGKSLTKQIDSVDEKIRTTSKEHNDRIKDLELARARQGGFIAAISAAVAAFVAIIKDYLGHVL